MHRPHISRRRVVIVLVALLILTAALVAFFVPRLRKSIGLIGAGLGLFYVRSWLFPKTRFLHARAAAKAKTT